MGRKYIDADRLKAEIERRRDSALERQKNLEKIGQETVLNEMIAFELNRLISFVASLQQEQPEFNILSNGSGAWGTTPPKFKLEVKEQPDELEEEMAEIWLEFCEDVDYLVYASIARHFAEWGMNQCPLPEDTTIFMKGVAEGKRLMMEEAVECFVEWYDGLYLNLTTEQMSNAIERAGAKVGDKVRVIVIPNTDEK